jgi:hypothetical protein
VLLAVGVDVPLTEADLTDGSHDQSHHDWIFFLVGSEAVTVPRCVLVTSPGGRKPPELSLQDDAARGEQRARDALRADVALPEGLEPSKQQPLFDSETGTYLTEIYQRADAFLFGRRTYEIFAASWGAVSDPSMNAVAESLHSRPKYVAPTTLTETHRANTTVLSSGIVDELRAQPGGELLVPGSGALIRGGCLRLGTSTADLGHIG